MIDTLPKEWMHIIYPLAVLGQVMVCRFLRIVVQVGCEQEWHLCYPAANKRLWVAEALPQRQAQCSLVNETIRTNINKFSDILNIIYPFLDS